MDRLPQVILALRNGHLHIADSATDTNLFAILEGLLPDDPDSSRWTGSQLVVRRPSGRPALVMAIDRLAGASADVEETFGPAVAVLAERLA